jgi:hypothetical protein
MKVSQLDQIKQAYEQGICTVQLLKQRVNAMQEVQYEFVLFQYQILLYRNMWICFEN